MLRHSSFADRHFTATFFSGFFGGRGATWLLSLIRMVTLAEWAVSPSLFARYATSSAISFKPVLVKERMLVRRRQSLAVRPLANRAVVPVGSTCDGPAA